MYGQSHLGSGLSGEQNSLQMGPIAGAQQTAMQQAISSAQQLGSVDQDMHDDGLDLLLDLNDKNDTEARGQQQDAQQQHDVITAAGQGGQIDAGDPARVWQQAFFKLASAAGVPVDPSQATSPDDIIQQVQAARQRDPWVQAQAREAALHVQAAVLTAENVHLRRELGSGWAASDPNIIQVQQLILDPAIEHEFQHLRTQLALRVAETEAAKAAYEGQAFTPESKNGHALLRKVQILAEENEDLGRQQRDNKQAAEGAIAAIERRHADELREQLQDARDLCNLYQQENEELSMATALYQRQVEVIKQQLASQPPPAAPSDRGYGASGSRSAPHRDKRPFERPRKSEQPPQPRGRPSADRPREHTSADQPRDRPADRIRDRGDGRDVPRDRAYDMDRSVSGGYSGGRGHEGRGGRGRGRGRNMGMPYPSHKRPR